VDVRAETARTKYKLAQVLRDAGQTGIEVWQRLKTEAQELRRELIGKEPDDEDNEASYEGLIAYFYR